MRKIRRERLNLGKERRRSHDGLRPAGVRGSEFCYYFQKKGTHVGEQVREKDGDPSSHLLSLRGSRGAAEISSWLVDKPG